MPGLVAPLLSVHVEIPVPPAPSVQLNTVVTPWPIEYVPPLAGELIEAVGGLAALYVYLSALEVALVPPGVLTVTSTVPVPAGDVAVTCVEVFTVKTALVDPKSTAVAPVRLVPVMVTGVPPACGPLVGESLVTVGAA